MQKVPGMTIQDIKTMDSECINVDVAAKVIGCNPHAIRVQAHQDPKKLGFPVLVINKRVKIPRIPFIKFMEGK